MAMTIDELREWLAPLDGTKMIGIDEGGLTLVVYDATASQSERSNYDNDATTSDAYYELGGVNVDEDDEDEDGNEG